MNERRRAGCLAATLLCVGCSQGLFDNDRTTYHVAPEKLSKLAATDLSARSTTPPVLPEDASREALDQVDPMPKWPERTDLTLAEVRSATVRNNLELRTQLVGPAIVQRALDAERAKFEATLFADYTRNSSNIVTDPVGERSGRDALDVGVNLPLMTGGTVSAFTDVSRAEPGLGGEFDGLGSWSTGLGFSISQPLLRNAGVNANTASIRIAEYDGQIASARTKLEAIRILADAEKAYWNLYGAYRELEVRKQEYELAVSQRDRAKRRIQQGDAPQIEVVRAESGIGSTLERIIVSDQNLRERVRELKRIMNRADLPIESGTLLVPVTAPSPVGLTLDSRTLASNATDNRMEMLELEIFLAADATNIALARNRTLPLFVIDYRYEPFGRANTFNGSVRNLGDFEEDSYNLALRGEIPLGNEAAKNRLARAVLERVQRLATKDQRRQAIRTEVYNAVDRLNTAWQRILAARLETVLAARTYDAERRQFDVGLRTSREVLDASSRLADAQSREVNALAQWQIAMVDIAFATGTLPGEAGVLWEPIDLEELSKQSLGDLDRVRE